MSTAYDYIRDFRAANPNYSSLDDATILQTAAEEAEANGQLAQHPVLQQALQSSREEDRGVGGELVEGLKRGAYGVKAKLYDTAALAGKLVGSDDLHDWGREGSDAAEAESASHGAAVGSYSDIHTVKDFAYYLAGELGSQVPMVAGTAAAATAAAALAPEEIVGGGVVAGGGLLARIASGLGLTAARTAAGEVAGASLAEGATGLAAKKVAGFLAAQTAGFTQMQSYSQLEKQGGDNVVPLAVANGLIAGALQTIIPLRFLHNAEGAVGEGVVNTATKEASTVLEHASSIIKSAPSWIVNPALHAAKEGSIGMLAGIAQEAVGVTTSAMAGGNTDLSTESVARRLIQGGISGFIGGGGMGLVQGIMEKSAAPAQANPAPSPEAQLQAPAAAPVQQAPLDVAAPQIKALARLAIDQPVGQTGYLEGMLPKPHEIAADGAEEASQFRPGEVAAPKIQTPIETPGQTELPLAQVPTIRPPLANAADRFAESDRARAAQAQVRNMKGAVGGTGYLSPEMVPDAAGRSFDRSIDRTLPAANDQSTAQEAAPAQNVKGQMTLDQYQKAQARAVSAKVETAPTLKPEVAPVSEPKPTLEGVTPAETPATPSIVSTHFDNGNSVTKFAYPDNPMPELLTQAKKGTALIAIFRDENGNEFSAPVVYNHNEVKVVPEGAKAAVGGEKLTTKEAAKAIVAERTQTGEKISESAVNQILNATGPSADVTKPQLKQRNTEVLQRAWELGWRGNSSDKISKYTEGSGMKLVGYAETAQPVTEGGLRPLPKEISAQGATEGLPIAARAVEKSGTPLVTKEIARQFAADTGLEAESIAGLLKQKDPAVKARALDELSKFILAGTEDKARSAFESQYMTDPKMREQIRASTESSLKAVAEELSHKTNIQKIGRNVSEAAGVAVDNDARARDFEFERQQPDGTPVSNEPIRQQFDRAVQTAQAHGIDVSVAQATKTLKEGGRYNPSNRSMMLVMKNVIEPSRQDLISTYHEIFHDMIEQSPPAVQDALRKLADSNAFSAILDGNPQADPRVAGKGSTLSPAQLTDERLVEAMALNGVDKQVAQGLVPAIWRAVKDHFIAAALYIQEKILGGKDFLGGKLAEAYADNMVSKIRAGDKLTLDSFLSNWAKPFTTAQATPAVVKDSVYAARRSIDNDGNSTYPKAPGLSSAAIEHNIDTSMSSLREKLAASSVVQDANVEDMLNDAGFTVKRVSADETKKIISDHLNVMIPAHRITIAAANELSRLHHQLHESHVASLPVYSEGELNALRALGKPQPGVPDYESFLSQFGLENADNKAQTAFDRISAQFKEEGFDPAEIAAVLDPKTRIDSLPTDGDKSTALAQAREQLQSDIAKAKSKIDEASAQFDKLSAKDELRRAQIISLDKNLLDLKESDKIVRQYVRGYLRDVPAQMERVGDRAEASGFMQGVLSEIEKTPENISKYTDKLINSINLDNVPLSGVLKAMFQLQRDGEFDIAKDAPSKIRSVLARTAEENPESPIADLVNLHGSPLKANALLAGIITFTKSEDHIAKVVEHQLFRTNEDIAALNKLREQLREKNDDKLSKALAAFELTQKNDSQLQEGLQNGLGVTRDPSNSTLYSWLKRRKDALTSQVDQYEAERVKNSGEAVLKTMTDMQAAIDQRIGAGFEAFMLPGAPIPNPADPSVSSKDVWSDKHSVKLLGRENGTLDQAQAESVMGNIKRWLDARKDDPAQQDMQYEALSRLYSRMRLSLYLQKDKYATIAGIASGHLESHARTALVSGTRSGELVSASLHRFSETMNSSRIMAIQEGAKIVSAAEKFYKAVKLNGVKANERYFNWAVDAFDTRRENVLTHEDAYNFLRDQVMKSNDPIMAPLKDARTWGLFKEWIKAELEGSKKLSDFNFVAKDGLVRDESLKVFNPQTQKMEAAVRAPNNRGVQTVPRFIADTALASVRDIVNKLRGIKDVGLTEVARDAGEDRASAMTRTIQDITSSDRVWHELITPLFTDNPNSTLPAPAREDGIRLVAPQERVKAAFKGRDVLAIAGEIYDSMGGSTEESRVQYQIKVASWMLRILNRLGDIASPQTSAADVTMDFTGLPRVMMDSRETTDFPTSWMQRKNLTSESIMQITHAIAANSAFGRDYKEMAAAVSDMAAEVAAKAKQWHDMTDPAERAKLRKNDRAQYDELKASDLKSKQLGSNGDRYFKTLNSLFSPDGVGNSDPSLMRDMWGLSVSMMLTGAKSAVRNLVSPVNRFAEAKSIAPEVWYDIGSAYTGIAQDFMASMWNTLGVKTWTPAGRYYKLLTDTLGGDPGQTLNLKEILAGHRGADFANDKSDARGKVAVRQFLTRMRAVLMHGKLSLSDNPTGPVLTVNPFQWTQIRMNVRDFFVEMRRYETTASKIADFYRENPDRVGQPVTAKDIGVSKSFWDGKTARWTEFGLDPHQLAQTMLKSAEGVENLDGDTLSKMWTYTTNGITGEASILNRPAFTQTSKFGKFTSTLLGFPMFQTAKIVEMARTAEGRTTLKSAAKALTVFSLGILPMSLAFSKVLDEYDEELVGKHTSNRPFNDDVGNNLMALSERVVAAGTLGFAGDIIPTALNVAGSPSGRNMMSLDNRIVWVNQALSLAKSVKDLLAMGPENANYANFVRPLLNTAGLLGPLQNLDVVNHLAQKMGVETRELPGVGGLLGAESDVINRSSVYAWLRGAAYANKLEVRGAGQGDYTPNAATPWVTDMALAAYSNDREGFQTAYRGAIRAAQGMGISTDAFSYVKRAYASRNPLLSVLKNRPSTGEYAMMLRTLPDDGRLAVQHAVTLFNMYGSGLGLQPFNGISADDPRRERRIQNTRIAEQRGWF